MAFPPIQSNMLAIGNWLALPRNTSNLLEMAIVLSDDYPTVETLVNEDPSQITLDTLYRAVAKPYPNPKVILLLAQQKPDLVTGPSGVTVIRFLQGQPFGK